MKASVRRTIEMGKRVLNFSVAHPDPSPGYTAALERLQKAVAEADMLAARQEDGQNSRRAATGIKRTLRRKMRRTQLLQLARVAESAANEVPEIAEKFRLTREAVPYLAFRTAARGMLVEGQNQKELLVRHGLLSETLDDLAKLLDKFDLAVDQGTDARRAHVGASADLDALSEELTQVARLLDGINHTRFAEDPDALAQWLSVRNVIGPPRRESGDAAARGSNGAGSDKPTAGEATPAA
jgi:hypothetical protein